ncbi:MAG: FtsX-like permease family protein, partial [Sinobacteraceae bacterium]|nr:FtsX-like permease family protein [Nevskiaceae bacterium]
MIVGRGAQDIFGLRVGDRVILPDGEWPIVGAFSNGGGLLESDLLSDADTLMSASRSDHFNSVLVQLQSPAAFGRFNRWLGENPGLAVTAQREADFYLRSTAPFTEFFTSMAFFIASILAIGALFGSLNIFYGRVRARTREIVTLRIFGFGALPIALSVVVESMLLALLGALVGVGCAWLLFNGKQSIVVHTVFALTVSSYTVVIGVGAALAIGLLGSLLPTFRAVRLPITEGLRET